MARSRLVAAWALSAGLLSACSGGGGSVVPSTGVLPDDAVVRAIAAKLPPSTGVWGQVVHALPETLTLDLCTHASDTFDALENFEGDVTATSMEPDVVSVTPDSQRNHVVPTMGGLKNAWFTVTAVHAGQATIVVRDRKGNIAFVSVTVTGSCCTSTASVARSTLTSGGGGPGGTPPPPPPGTPGGC
jgi:hypothetical protein